MVTAKLPPTWVDAAGALYLDSTRQADARPGSIDLVTSRFLRANPALGHEGRGFVVGTAQDMMRSRRRIEAAAAQLGYEPTRAGLACLWLVGARKVSPRTLPIDPRGAPELERAWQASEAAPLHVRASVPEWLVDELRRERNDADALCLAFTDTPASTLRANTLKVSREALLEALARDGVRAAPTRLAPDAVSLVERTNVFRTRAFQEGLFEVQDEGSQLVSLLCEAQPGMVVVDGCAGAGGKTLHLAAQMQGRGTLYAFDVANHRLEALRQRARRADAHNIRVHSLDDPRARKRLADAADVVLVDAPCSGTGVLRRNPDTGWRLTPDDVKRMCGQQLSILSTYAPLVKPGGRLVYATCSVLRRENEEVVAAFLERHPGFSVRPARHILEQQGALAPELAAMGDALSLDPLRHATDGFFGCALVRNAG